jgi:hypothetical protein
LLLPRHAASQGGAALRGHLWRVLGWEFRWLLCLHLHLVAMVVMMMMIMMVSKMVMEQC